jgi:hypothetical protein
VPHLILAALLLSLMPASAPSPARERANEDCAYWQDSVGLGYGYACALADEGYTCAISSDGSATCCPHDESGCWSEAPEAAPQRPRRKCYEGSQGEICASCVETKGGGFLCAIRHPDGRLCTVACDATTCASICT